MERAIPLVDVARQNTEVAQEVKAGWERVLASGRFVLGPELLAFENELAASVGAGAAVGVGNGTDALELALRAAGTGANDQVVVPALTFLATAGAVLRIGAEPVLVDVDPTTLLIDVDQAVDALRAGARAVVPVDLHGRMAPVAELAAFAGEHGAAVVQDAAQSHGATRGGRGPGGLGVVAATSFYPSKNLGAAGDGGAILVPDQATADRVRAMRNHGDGGGSDTADGPGWNSRLDELQAVVLRAKLRRLPAWVDARRTAAARYDTLLAGIEGVAVPERGPAAEHACHLYAIQVGDRDTVLARLRATGIGASTHYARPLHHEPVLARCNLGGPFPVAEAAAARLLSLPLDPLLTPADQDRVVACLAEAVAGAHDDGGSWSA